MCLCCGRGDNAFTPFKWKGTVNEFGAGAILLCLCEQSRWKSRLAKNWPTKRKRQRSRMGLVESWRLMLFVWFHSFLSLRVFSTKLSSVLALRSKEARMTTKMRANWRNGSKTNEKVQSSTSSFPFVRMRTSEVRGAHRTGINGNIEMKMYSDKHTHPRICVCVCVWLSRYYLCVLPFHNKTWRHIRMHGGKLKTNEKNGQMY